VAVVSLSNPPTRVDFGNERSIPVFIFLICSSFMFFILEKSNTLGRKRTSVVEIVRNKIPNAMMCWNARTPLMAYPLK